MDMDTCWLRLANGWTVSLSISDTPPAICSVVAWPTRQDILAMGSATFHELSLFDFGTFNLDCRCWSYSQLRDALKKVGLAPDISELRNLGMAWIRQPCYKGGKIEVGVGGVSIIGYDTLEEASIARDNLEGALQTVSKDMRNSIVSILETAMRFKNQMGGKNG